MIRPIVYTLYWSDYALIDLESLRGLMKLRNTWLARNAR